VGRLQKQHLVNQAELAVLIVDEYQGLGLGTEMTRSLVEIARIERLDRVTLDVLAENRQMLEVCLGLGFHLEHEGAGVVHGVLEI
jgi:acetyltransferase